jgi:hypothetical protein
MFEMVNAIRQCMLPNAISCAHVEAISRDANKKARQVDRAVLARVSRQLARDRLSRMSAKLFREPCWAASSATRQRAYEDCTVLLLQQACVELLKTA